MNMTLGQKFDAATQKFDETTEGVFGTKHGYDSAQKLLGLIQLKLVSHSNVPDNDFHPQFKSSKEEPRFPESLSKNPSAPMMRHEANIQHLSNLEEVRKIKFISLERNGVEHDFPIRLTQKAPTLLARAFTGSLEPKTTITITGIDGTERSFTRNGNLTQPGDILLGDFAKRAAEFMVMQLQQKALQMNKPSAKSAPTI